MNIGNWKFGVKTLVAVAFISAVVGIAVTARFDSNPVYSAQNSFWKDAPHGKDAPARPAAAPPSFVDLAKRQADAVVNISTTQVVKGRRAMPFPEFKTPFDDFFGDDFDKFFGAPPKGEFKKQSLGSGFIINKDGYIITNHHVIENANDIVVTLSNHKKKEFHAKVVGKDANIDIALIKIDAGEDLPSVTLGDSDKIEVGEWVVAIGNPFGLGGTVTAGILSQRGRVIGAGPYDNFLQTDASINPGNSGGPLFNLNGEVIGINTAIVAGGSGIGFAIPINMAKDELVQLKDTGKYIRGWIGVSIQEVTPDIAESFGLKEPHGALISATVAGDPAATAGIQPGDIIIEFDGREITEHGDLPKAVAATPPGKKAKVKALRDGKEQTFFVTVAKKKDTDEDEDGGDEDEDKEDGAVKKLGITVSDMTPEAAKRLNVDDKDGALISAVNPDGPAAAAGLKRGDIIKEVNRKKVSTAKECKKELDASKKNGSTLLLIKRGDGVFYVAIKIK